MSFFLCLGGFLRLSGMMRSVCGDPSASRARRRASFAARNFFGFRNGLTAATSSADYILGFAYRRRLCRLLRAQMVGRTPITGGARSQIHGFSEPVESDRVGCLWRSLLLVRAGRDASGT